MTEHHDPEKELHGVKARLAALKEDLHDVVTDTKATVRHYGHWNKEAAKEMMEDIDTRLERAIKGLEAKEETAHPDAKKEIAETTAGLHALRSDLNDESGAHADGTADHETIESVEEFHNRVDDHLAYLRKSGREW
jgi:hypothetical protein